METMYDLIIIGGGPGGYVAAIRARQLGLTTALIEKDKLGGVCLNWGCIPSKALIHQAELFGSIADLRKTGITVDTTAFNYEKVYQSSRNAASKLSKGVEFLMKKNGVTVVSGTAEFTDANHVTVNGTTPLAAKNFLIATGSSPRSIPGFDFDEQGILSSTGALSMKTLPKSIAILGAGAIGVEFSYILSSFGVEVHCIEMLDQVLPLEDSETVEVVVKALRKGGVTFSTGTKALSCSKVGNNYSLQLEKNGTQQTLEVEKILVAVGRKPNSEGLGLDKLGITTDNGFIPVGDYYATKVPNIHAIGDVIKTPLLAHVASAEGECAVERIAGHAAQPRIDYTMVPSAVYCEPQIASFGLTENRAAQQRIPFKKAVFPYRGAGKSIAIEKPEGMVKILYNPDTREIIGGHIAGTEATEIIHELLLARSAELLPEDIGRTIHAHPSISEAIREAANLVDGKAIHI